MVNKRVIGDDIELTKKQLARYFKAKKNSIIEITVEGNLIEGGNIVNITVDDLPDDIKELIELGLYTEEEAVQSCAVGNSSRERRMVITKPLITYVGEGETRKPTVSYDNTKYSPEDIVLYATYLAGLNLDEDIDDTDDDDGFVEIIDETESDEDDELLALLGDI